MSETLKQLREKVTAKRDALRALFKNAKVDADDGEEAIMLAQLEGPGGHPSERIVQALGGNPSLAQLSAGRQSTAEANVQEIWSKILAEVKEI
ncbi:hypothetical protein LCGC14_2892450, partial [marine sediment metagenome]